MKRKRFPLTAKLTLSVLGLMLCLWLAAGAVLVASTMGEVLDGLDDQGVVTRQQVSSIYALKTWTDTQDDLVQRNDKRVDIVSWFRRYQEISGRYVGYYTLSKDEGAHTPSRLLAESMPALFSLKPGGEGRLVVLKGLSGRELREISERIDHLGDDFILEAVGAYYGDHCLYANTLTVNGKTYTIPGAPEGQERYTHSAADEQALKAQFPQGNHVRGVIMFPRMTSNTQWTLLPEAAAMANIHGGFGGFLEDDREPPQSGNKYLRDYRSWATLVPQPDGTSLYLSGLIACAPLRTALEENAATLLKLLVLLLALGAGTALVTVRVVVRPLQRTAAEAGKVAGLDFDDFRPDTARRDELGDLNRALKSMSEDLRRRWEGERALERRRQDFVAAASHDLKTPLALIRGYAEAVEQSIDPAENARYLASIQREADKMDRLVLDLLDATRLQRLETLERTEPVALDGLLRFLLEEMAPALAGRRVEADLAPVQLTGDPDLLKRALGNVLSNAARYTPPGGRIALRLEIGPELTIENEGPTIAPEDLPRIFELFYRGDRARTRSDDHGSGVGLAVTRRILALHGLECGIENTETGVRFYMGRSAAP